MAALPLGADSYELTQDFLVLFGAPPFPVAGDGGEVTYTVPAAI